MEPKRYPKPWKMQPKGNQNEQKNLQWHPFGTWSNKYRKRMPKGAPRRWLWEAIWRPKSITNHKKHIPENMQKSIMGKHKQWWQNNAKREPEIIDFSSFLWEEVTLGNCQFYTRKKHHFEDQRCRIQWKSREQSNPKNMCESGMEKTQKSIQNGFPKGSPKHQK